MNKKIKVIELLNKIANNEQMPKKVKFGDDILSYDVDVEDYMGISKTGSGSFFNYLFVNNATSLFINEEVEILEDEEKINIQEIELAGLKSFVDADGKIDNVNLAYKYNELVLAVKQLDKKINKE